MDLCDLESNRPVSTTGSETMQPPSININFGSKPAPPEPLMKEEAKTSGIFDTIGTVAKVAGTVLGFLDKPGNIDCSPNALGMGVGTMDLSSMALTLKDYNSDSSANAGSSPFTGDLHQLLQYPCILETFDWLPSSTGQLAVLNVSPWVSDMRTHLAYYSQFYKFFRGTLIYDVTLFSNCFYNGQLAAVHIPPENNVPQNFDDCLGMYTQQFGPTLGKNNISIPVRYSRIQEYCNAGPPTPSSNNGQLAIYVTQPLVGSGTAGSMDVMVEIRAGEDFQFAYPFFRQDLFFTTWAEGGTRNNIVLDTQVLNEVDFVVEIDEGVSDLETETGDPDAVYVDLEAAVNPPNESFQSRNETVDVGLDRGQPVKTFDTSSIVGRTYVIAHNKPWSDTDGRFSSLQSIEMPTALYDDV